MKILKKSIEWDLKDINKPIEYIFGECVISRDVVDPKDHHDRYDYVIFGKYYTISRLRDKSLLTRVADISYGNTEEDHGPVSVYHYEFDSEPSVEMIHKDIEFHKIVDYIKSNNRLPDSLEAVLKQKLMEKGAI